MNALLHRLAAVFGPVAALVPQFTHALPPGTVSKVVSVAGVVVTLLAQLPKALGFGEAAK